MKQTLFMVALTLFGTVGALYRPVRGALVYYFFAVLRPHYMWVWVLPGGVAWSQYVAYGTLIGTLISPRDPNDQPARKWTEGHTTMMLFGAGIIASYLTAYDREVAYLVFVDYMKIFLMFAVSSVIFRKTNELWLLFLITAGSLAYIAYEVNYLYFINGYLGIQRNGYAGLDNNGAGLMLAMGVPLCIFAWESLSRLKCLPFLLLTPAIIHAVMMTYSRGAMLSLVIATPLMIALSRYRLRFGLSVVAFALLVVPIMAGAEIKERFLSIQDQEVDESAQSRRQSWAAGWAIARDNPIFGVGIRNSNLFTYKYGADMEGRTIHNQYIQIAADSGFVGLSLYLLTLLSAFWSLRKARQLAARIGGAEGSRLRAMASGTACSLGIFCFGAIFLSLEVFELPYILIFLAMQLRVVAENRLVVIGDGVAPNGGGTR
jgi:probable O-glycosylation ligase (exosortase A-associated)